MRSIKWLKSYDGLVRRLAETPHPVNKKSIFPTMRELISFAAMLGFEKQNPQLLKGETNEIDWRIWQNNQLAMDLLFLIPLAHSQSADILREESEDELLDIFEQYANGGLEILQGWLNDKPDDLNGDRAILAALQKHGFLEPAKRAEDVLADVEF
jgi:dnd system-associated protein 4